jgi:hypothetical protein
MQICYQEFLRYAKQFEVPGFFPSSPAVYTVVGIIDGVEKVLYVGATQNLRQRWQGHGHDRKREIQTLERVGITVFYRALLPNLFCPLDNVEQLQAIEKALIGELSPCLNESPTMPKTPTLGYPKVSVVIELRSVKKPPIRESKKVSITLPDITPDNLDLNLIKESVGGKNGYLRGNHLATASLSNKRIVSCYCSTQEDALKRLFTLTDLLEPSVLSYSVHEHEKSITPFRVFPYKVKIYIDGEYKDHFPLWLDSSVDANSLQKLLDDIEE